MNQVITPDFDFLEAGFRSGTHREYGRFPVLITDACLFAHIAGLDESQQVNYLEAVASTDASLKHLTSAS
jgi:hypothetical protein